MKLLIIIIIIIFWLKHQYLKHKYQSMVQQIIANMLSETVYTGITNLYIITKNQQNTKQYIINVNSVLVMFLFTYCAVSFNRCKFTFSFILLETLFL